MAKVVFIALVIFICSSGHAQQGFIAFKKKKKSIQYFWKDSQITFQLRDSQWLSGVITKIAPDSFYFTKEIIRYQMTGPDTLHFKGFAFSLNDIYALPSRKQLVVYDQDRVKLILGHEKFVWIRNGFIFQAAGGGYILLNIANTLINNDPPFAKKNLAKLGIGTAVFLLGELLHFRFDPILHIGKKYHLETIMLQDIKKNQNADEL